MEKFKKLSRDEMRNVTGGKLAPPSSQCGDSQAYASCCNIAYGGTDNDPVCITACWNTPLPDQCTLIN